MKQKITRIGILGAAGKMGREITRQISNRKDCKVGVAIEKKDSPFLGLDSGDLAGVHPNGCCLTDSLDAFIGKVDVLIDFSIPESTLNTVRFCCDNKLPIVIGTTGFGDKTSAVTSSSSHIPIVLAPNMSIGVNLSFKVVELAAEILADQFDVEIIEAHHRDKIDAPSGTALRLGEIVAKKKGSDLKSVAVFGREGRTGPRKKETIGFETVRAGDIVGDHTVLFAGKGERIEITHRASDRSAFATGAIVAARWLDGKEPGLFDMQDVLGLA